MRCCCVAIPSCLKFYALAGVYLFIYAYAERPKICSILRLGSIVWNFGVINFKFAISIGFGGVIFVVWSCYDQTFFYAAWGGGVECVSDAGCGCGVGCCCICLGIAISIYIR